MQPPGRVAIVLCLAAAVLGGVAGVVLLRMTDMPTSMLLLNRTSITRLPRMRR